MFEHVTQLTCVILQNTCRSAKRDIMRFVCKHEQHILSDEVPVLQVLQPGHFLLDARLPISRFRRVG